MSTTQPGISSSRRATHAFTLSCARITAEADFLQFASLDLAPDLDDDKLRPSLLTSDGLLAERYINSDTALHYIPRSLYESMTPLFLHGYILVERMVDCRPSKFRKVHAAPLPTKHGGHGGDQGSRHGPSSNFRACLAASPFSRLSFHRETVETIAGFTCSTQPVAPSFDTDSTTKRV